MQSFPTKIKDNVDNFWVKKSGKITKISYKIYKNKTLKL